MKRLGFIFGVLFLVSSFEPLAMAQPSSELIIVNTTDAVSMDPLVEWMTDGMVMMKQMYDHLVDFDKAGNVRYCLAVSHNLVDDKTWHFKLREGVRFHNGDPFTAEDAKFTLERILDPEMRCTYRARFRTIDQINVLDDYTLEIKTTTPDPVLLNRLAFFPRVVPKKYIEEKGLEHFRKNPIGTGPFKFVSWVPKGELVMEANEEWWGGPAKTRRLVFRSLPEMASRVAELQAGRAHIVTGVPSFMIPQLARDKDIEIQSPSSLRVVFFVVNALAEGPLQDKRVRQALNYGIDKEAIIEGILKGSGIQTSTMVSPHAFGYDDLIKPYPFDPVKAKSLLKEAGYGDGFKLTVNSPSGRYPNDKEVATAVNDMLRGIGIEASLLIQESGTYVSKFINHQLEGIFLLGMSYLYRDVDSSYAFFDKANPYCHYENPDIYSLVKEAQSQMNQEMRKGLASKIQEKMYQDASHIFLYNQVDNYGVSRRVTGFRARQDDYMDLTNVSVN